MLRLVLRGASALAGGSRPKLVAGPAKEARQGPGEEGLAGGQTSSRRGGGATSPPLSALPCPRFTPLPPQLSDYNTHVAVSARVQDAGMEGVHSALATMELPAWSFFSIGPISGGEDRGLVGPEGDSWRRPDFILRGREEKAFALAFSSLGASL